jgi:L-ascorbate metabolism protein UlaG (beta-lactamase superfamily)
MVTVRWLGAAGLELTADGQTVLIDPYLSRPGKREIFFSRLTPNEAAITRYLAGLPGRLTAVTVGHTHVDHALDIPEIARRSQCPIFGGRSLDVLLGLHGLSGRVTVVESPRPFSPARGITIEMLPSAHGRVILGRIPYPGSIRPGLRPPLKATDYRLGEVYATKITMAGKTFLHFGSANFIPAAIAGHRCQVLFVCVPGWRRTPGYPRLLLDGLEPETVVPFHFDDFTVPLPASGRFKRLPFLGMRGFLEMVKTCRPQADIHLPEPGRPITF